MYDFIKQTVLKILRVPPEPLDPMGDVKALKVFRASPNFFKYRLYVWIIKNFIFALFGAVILAVVVGVASQAPEPGQDRHLLFVVLILLVMLSLAAFLASLLLSYTVMRLDYEMRWYKVSDRSLRIREGIFHVKEITMTFDNIQNISVSQGPIQRFFGIADLKVETAGGGGGLPAQASHHQEVGFKMHIGYFRGIDNFQEIRDMMVRRLKKLKDSGLGDNDDISEKNQNAAVSIMPGKLVREFELLRDEAAMFRKAVEKLSMLKSTL